MAMVPIYDRYEGPFNTLDDLNISELYETFTNEETHMMTLVWEVAYDRKVTIGELPFLNAFGLWQAINQAESNWHEAPNQMILETAKKKIEAYMKEQRGVIIKTIIPEGDKAAVWKPE